MNDHPQEQMQEEPTCPIHTDQDGYPRPMRQFDWGWKCTAVTGRNQDGSKVYCEQRWTPRQKAPQRPVQARPAPHEAPRPSPAPSPASGAARPSGRKEVDPAVWIAKERLGAAQTALTAAAMIFESCPDRATEAMAWAEAFRNFLEKAKAGEPPVPPSLIATLPLTLRRGLENATPLDAEDPDFTP